MYATLLDADYAAEGETPLTNYVDYTEQLHRFIEAKLVPELVRMYLAVSYSFYVLNEMLLDDEGYDLLCKTIRESPVKDMKGACKAAVKMEDLKKNRCTLTVVEEGKKAKLGHNYPPQCEDLIAVFDSREQVKGSVHTCLDS